MADNVAPVAANVGAGSRLKAFGSIIGPPDPEPVGGQIQPIGLNCRVSHPESFGYNFVSDASCGLDGVGDVIGMDPMLAPHLADNGGRGETRLPLPGSPVLDRIPAGDCAFTPFGYDLEGEQHLARFGIDPIAPITTDQRGVSRPQDVGCDVGAVEVGLLSAPALRPLPAPNPAKAGNGPTLDPSNHAADTSEGARSPARETRETGHRHSLGRHGRGRHGGSGGWARRSAPWREGPTSTRGGW